MRRTIAGLIALPVFCAALNIGDSEAGWRRRSRQCCDYSSAMQSSDCCPSDTCCRPQPAVCATSGVCCSDGGVLRATAAYMCISGLMFTYADNTCSYVGTCYNDNTTCQVPPGYTCMEDLNSGLSNSSCAASSTPSASGCYTLVHLRRDQCGRLQVVRPLNAGLQNPVVFQADYDQNHLGPGVSLVNDASTTFLVFDTRSGSVSNSVSR